MPLGQVQVPFPDSSMPGIRQQESGGRIINGYIEPLGAGAPQRTIWRRAPGLRNFGTTVRAGFRGGVQVGGTAYCAFANRIVTLTSTGGAATDIGALAGTAKGFFARNNRVASTAPLNFGPDIVFCDPDGNAFNQDNTGGFVTLVRPAAMGAPNSVCSIDGFFVFTLGSGEIWASDLNSTTINALSFARAESKPDGLTRGIPWAGNLFLFGPATTEVWSNVGTTPFPFQRSVVIPRGIAGPFCVAGFEDNFSRALIWVADDNTVVRLNGYTPEKISPPDLDGLIEDVTDKRMLEMSVYMARGHAFVMLSASKASPSSPWREWSWVFDLNNDRWAERQSHLRDRSRITGGFYAFNKWLCGDLLSNNVQEITDTVHTEAPTSQLITGAAAGNGGQIRLTVADTSQIYSHVVSIVGVLGTLEANGTWPIFIIDSTHFELVGSVFTNPFAPSPGIVTGAVNLPFRWRLESGAVENFPVGARVGRFDCEFVTGVGKVTGDSRQRKVTGCFANNPPTDNRMTLTFDTGTAGLTTGEAVSIAGVGGVPTANGIFSIIVFPLGILLSGVDFAGGPYTGGGVLTQIGPLDPIESDPVVEISWSDDGGQNYLAPIVRKLGRQSMTRELVSLISCTGRSGWTARRWRLDISDPVHVGFMAAFQNISPKVSDIG